VKQVTVLFAICALFNMAPTTASAAEAVQRWTLKEAISTALTRNNLVKAAGFSADAAGHGTVIAHSRYYPGIFFEETFAASNAPTHTFMMKLDQARFNQNDFQINNLNHPASHHNFKTALSIQQPLYDPSSAAMVEMAQKEAEKGTLALDGVRQDVAFQTFQLYLEVQKAAAQLNATEQALTDARENMRLAKVRNEAGLGLRSDELRARTHLSNIEQQNITAQNNLLLAQLQLANTLGLTEGLRAEIATPAGMPIVASTEQELAVTAVEMRTDLRLARVEQDSSEAAITLARSAYLPSLSAFASYQMDAKNSPLGNDNDAWLVGASLKWQLFDGFKRSAERNRASANSAAAREMLANRTRLSSYQVTESTLRYKETGKRLEVARHAVADAEETVRLLSRRFENSLATMAELLDAQTALFQVRAGLVETEANYALAGGRVYYSAGIFLKEIMK
jgi:outer membrane protein TolC